MRSSLFLYSTNMVVYFVQHNLYLIFKYFIEHKGIRSMKIKR